MKSVRSETELLRILEEYSPTGENYAQLILEIEQRSRRLDIIVPILGTQGMGKSTMVNSLIGEDILPYGADETTCVPVEVRYGEIPCGEVYLHNEELPVRVSTKHELGQYVDNKCNPGNQKKVSHIILYRNHRILKTGLVIVDLPGVGSLTKSNEETTKRYIENLCAAIFIISSCPPILQTEANFISAVWRGFNVAYFVQNVWDDHLEDEVNDGLIHNQKVLNDIAEKINTPMSHPIIPVNAYSAIKGTLIDNQGMIEKSNINELSAVLEDFAYHYREQSEEALDARIAQFVAAAIDQIDYRMDLLQMSNEELLRTLEQEKTRFAAANKEIAAIALSIRLQLDSNRREMQVFAENIAKKYADLLRVDLFSMIERGVLDGENLTKTFSEKQSEYAEDALDKAHENFSDVCESLREQLEELSNVISREEMHSPEARIFNKAQALKWEKGMDAIFKIGGAGGGAWVGLLVSGIPGVLFALGIGLLGSFLGNASHKIVTNIRARETKRQITPYILEFQQKLSEEIIASFERLVGKIRHQLSDYVTARDEQIKAIQKQIDTYAKKGAAIDKELYNLEKDRAYLKDWRCNCD